MGRLFDAAAAVLGVCRVARFEGEAAMRLEALADSRSARLLPFPRRYDPAGRIELDPVPLLSALGEALRRGGDVGDLAAAFHESVACATADVVIDLCGDNNVGVVALSGGVFQNARLTASIRTRLEIKRLRVLTPIALPANDGGLSYGQAIVAAATLRRDQ